MKSIVLITLLGIYSLLGYGQSIYISGYVNENYMDSISDLVYNIFQKNNSKKLKIYFVDYSEKVGESEPAVITLKKKMKYSAVLDQFYTKSISNANGGAIIPFKTKRLDNLKRELLTKNSINQLAILDKCGVFSNDENLQEKIAGNLNDLLEVNPKAKIYVLSFYEPSLKITNLAIEGKTQDNISSELLVSNNKVVISGDINSTNSNILRVAIYVNDKEFNLPITQGSSQFAINKQLNLVNGELNIIKIVVFYGQNRRTEQDLKIRVLDNNQVSWIRPSLGAEIINVCWNKESKSPLLVFKFQTSLPITNLTLNIVENDNSSRFVFRIKDYVEDIWDEKDANKSICLKINPEMEFRNLGYGGTYFPCQWKENDILFNMYFTYSTDADKEIQVSESILNIQLIDNGTKDVNKLTDDDRPICPSCN